MFLGGDLCIQVGLSDHLIEPSFISCSSCGQGLTNDNVPLPNINPSAVNSLCMLLSYSLAL